MSDEDNTHEEVNATDAAIAAAEEAQLNLDSVEGTGVDGRITKGDVDKAIAAIEEEANADLRNALLRLREEEAAAEEEVEEAPAKAERFAPSGGLSIKKHITKNI